MTKYNSDLQNIVSEITSIGGNLLLKREKLLSTNDHILTPDILSLNKLIISGKIIQKAKQAINLV